MVFFGTPFRGAEGLSQAEMIEAALREYDEDMVQGEVLRILAPGNEFLQDLVDKFGKIRSLPNKAEVACFYELRPSNVGAIVGKQKRIRFAVSESSGCLDLSDATVKISLSRTHFEMNKFGKPTEEDFQTASEVIEGMVERAPKLVLTRSQYQIKHRIPFNPNRLPLIAEFVPRETEMTQLEEFFLDSSVPGSAGRQVFVICGLGGIGKTQLAAEFARKNYRRFTAVFWVNGSSEQTVRQSFASILQLIPETELTNCSQALGQSEANTDTHTSSVLRWLSVPSNRQWLLIFDNVDHDEENRIQAAGTYNLQEIFPPADHGSILITSRLKSFLRFGSGLVLKGANHYQAVRILEGSAKSEIQDAHLVVDKLGGLPLALTQAGAYLGATKMPVSAWLDLYHETWKALMESQDRFIPHNDTHRGESALTMWNMSYNSVEKESRDAALLLKFWAILDYGNMWHGLIAHASRLEELVEVPEWLKGLANDELRFYNAMGVLTRYSLVDQQAETMKGGSTTYTVHPVVHKWCSQLSGDSEKGYLVWVAAGLLACFLESNIRGDPEHIKAWGHILQLTRDLKCPPESFIVKDERFLQWALHNLSNIGSEHQHFFEVWWACLLAEQYATEGKLSKAVELCNSAHKIIKDIPSLNKEAKLHTTVLLVCGQLGDFHKDNGDLAKAEELYCFILKTIKDTPTLEEENPLCSQTLYRLKQLADLYRDQKDLLRAEELCITILNTVKDTSTSEIRENKMTLYSAALYDFLELGNLYENQNDLTKAEGIYGLVLKSVKDAPALMKKNTLYLGSLYQLTQLAVLYKDQKDLVKVEEVCITILDAVKDIPTSEIGKYERTICLVALYQLVQLGDLYKDQTNLAKAEELYIKTINTVKGITTSEIGTNEITYYSVAIYQLMQLGDLYEDQNNLAKAEELYNVVLNAGKDASLLNTKMVQYSSILSRLMQLGRVYKDQNDLAKAGELYSLVIRSIKTTPDIDEPMIDLLFSISNEMRELGNLYKDRGDVENSVKLYSSALKAITGDSNTS